MELEKKLDDLLAYVDAFIIVNHPKQQHSPGFGSWVGNTQLDVDDLIELLEILAESKYIEFGKTDSMTFYAKIKVKGRLFIKSNGYAGILERKNQEKAQMIALQKAQSDLQKTQTGLQKWMMWLTLALVLQGLLTLAWTIWKDTHVFCLENFPR